jgi:hypothetical protein
MNGTNLTSPYFVIVLSFMGIHVLYDIQLRIQYFTSKIK